MGVIVTTTRRAYYLTLHSVRKTPFRVVRWTYPPDPQPSPATASILPHGQQRFHVGYQIALPDPPPMWAPYQVLDDGRKTYVLFPPVALFAEVPMIRLLGPAGPQLTNARQYGNVIIVDQLVGAAELRLGAGRHVEVVTIRRGPLRTIQCPGDAACPVWPSEPEGIYDSRHIQ
jgi:type IV secretion system protein VirB9